MVTSTFVVVDVVTVVDLSVEVVVDSVVLFGVAVVAFVVGVGGIVVGCGVKVSCVGLTVGYGVVYGLVVAEVVVVSLSRLCILDFGTMMALENKRCLVL